MIASNILKDKKKLRVVLIAGSLFLICFAGIFWLAITLSGSFSTKAAPTDSTATAFNAKLPDANLPESNQNKLEIYMQAQKDSIKRQQALGEPLTRSFFNPGPPQEQGYVNEGASASSTPTTAPSRKVDANEKRVNDRLKELYNVLESSKTTALSAKGPVPSASSDPEPSIAELQEMITAHQQKSSDDNGEMQQYNIMLDKILDIQNPERIAGRNKAATGVTVPPLSVSTNSTPTSPLHYSLPGEEGVTNGFYGLQSITDSTTRRTDAIRAVVHQTQTLQEGSTIKLRLLQSIFINGKEIPANQLISGKCSISDERLIIQLDKLTYQGTVYPVALTVYDGTDGQMGLYVPGAITRDAMKDNADRAIQSIGLTSLDPSLGAQAASAGIETAKTLLSRKVKNITVTAKAGDVLILQNITSL